MNRIERRAILATCTTLLACGVLLYLAAGPPSSSSSSSPAAAANLPARLSDNEFWRMISDFSEAGGYFRSDNFLSNEAGYQYVIPVLKRTVQILPGGVYLGVGPEQNFTYLIAFEPKMAFIVDIRRGNMLEHLLYKALMETSADRVEFLSRLFSRPRPALLQASSSPGEIVRAYQVARPSQDLFDTNARFVLDHLEKAKGFALSKEDEASV